MLCFLFFTSSIFVNTGFTVRRDFVYSLVDFSLVGDAPLCSFVPGKVSHCSMHGFVCDDNGVLCVFDMPVVLPSVDDRSVRSAYNLTIGLNYWVIPELNNVVITRKVCDGFCRKFDFGTILLHDCTDELISYGEM